MKDAKLTVFEKNGVMYYAGVVVNLGDYVTVHGVSWEVLGGGRSTGKSQAPFLWLRNDQFGTALFAPVLDPNSPHRMPRTVEHEIVPKLRHLQSLVFYPREVAVA